MIVFVPDTLINEVRSPYMETHLQYTKNINKFIFLSIGSAYQNAFPLKLLPNISQEMYDDWRKGRNFDMEYASSILSDLNRFSELMKIIYPLYIFTDIAIVVIYNKDSEWLYDTIESIAKLIQQRYGIVSYMINDLSDFDFIEESTPTVSGLLSFDRDKEIFIGTSQTPNYWEVCSGREIDFLK